MNHSLLQARWIGEPNNLTLLICNAIVKVIGASSGANVGVVRPNLSYIELCRLNLQTCRSTLWTRVTKGGRPSARSRPGSPGAGSAPETPAREQASHPGGVGS